MNATFIHTASGGTADDHRRIYVAGMWIRAWGKEGIALQNLREVPSSAVDGSAPDEGVILDQLERSGGQRVDRQA